MAQNLQVAFDVPALFELRALVLHPIYSNKSRTWTLVGGWLQRLRSRAVSKRGSGLALPKPPAPPRHLHLCSQPSSTLISCWSWRQGLGPTPGAPDKPDCRTGAPGETWSPSQHPGPAVRGDYLQDLDVGQVVWTNLTAVDLDVLQPLDVGLRVTVHLTHELHIAAQGHRLVGRQSRLQDGPVRGALCGQREWCGPGRDALPSPVSLRPHRTPTSRPCIHLYSQCPIPS